MDPSRGLNVGAPVLFQGVQIGSVTSIILEVDPSNLHLQIPVVIEYEPDKFQVAGGGRMVQRDPRKTIPKLIERGLRAQLTMQSFITGQLVIELGFYPDSAICYPPAQPDKTYKDYIVIPTCQSTSERLATPWRSWISRGWKSIWNRPWTASLNSSTTRTWPPASGP